MDIVSILALSICVLLPYFGIMTIIAVISYRAKLKSAVKLFERYQTIQSSDQVKSKLPAGLKVLILVELTLLGILICLIVITIGNYLNIPWISDIDITLLGKILIAAFVIGTISVIVGSVLFNYLFKIDN